MQTDNKIGFLNLAVLVLTVYVLGALVVDTFWILPVQTKRLLEYIDYVLCTFFFFEFCYRFYHAEDKKDFMKWGWIDLLSCIPMIEYFRASRLIRLIRLIHIIRAFRTANQLIHHIFKSKAEGTITSVSVLTILLLIFSTIGILAVEHDPNSNIKTAEDAIWWTYTTITTVGYGDKYPVTTEGRILAMILMTFGVGLFGTYTFYISSIFVKEKETKSS